MSDIRSLVANFTAQLAALIENQTLAQGRAAVEAALGGRAAGPPSRVAPLAIGRRSRKKPPKQFCPVPGCKNIAAPVFGMVCGDHKNVAKTKIKKYCEERKAKKLGLKPPKARKRAKPSTKLTTQAKRARRRTGKAAPPTSAAPPAGAAA